jgi:hypothetical protein
MCDRSGRVQYFGNFGPVPGGEELVRGGQFKKYSTNKVCSILFLPVYNHHK